MPCENCTCGDARHILEGVPRIGFHIGDERCPESVPYCSALRACLEYIEGNSKGRPIPAHGKEWRLDLGYTRIMAYSGAAFRLTWKHGWNPDNVDLAYIAENVEEPFLRPIEMLGYGHRVLRKEGTESEAVFLDNIVRSIREQGRPVLAFGVIGPPECCLIAGYDEDGDVLIGWNFFQHFPEFSAGIEFEGNGYFRKRDWFRDTDRLILIGEKRAAMDPVDALRQTIEHALAIVRTPMIHQERHNGLAAFSAWAEALGRDNEIPQEPVAAAMDLHAVHDDAVGTVAEGRWYAAQYLKLAAEEIPRLARPLRDAATEYEAIHDIMWGLWELAGGPGRTEEQARRFADRGTRRRMVPLILQARDRDARAAVHLARTLNALTS